jgi:hypothetical protein
MQRSILGVEAYLPGALFHASAVLGVATSELMAKLRAPSSFGSKSYVANVYHRMPAAVHPELSLKHLDQALFEHTVLFYQKVRNPLFHGKQFHKPKIEELRRAFQHIGELYQWIDYWHDPKKVFKNSIQFGPLTITIPITFTEDAP